MLDIQYKDNKIHFAEVEWDIRLPISRVELYLNKFRNIKNLMYALGTLDNIEYYQKQTPNYPYHQISDYCLYLGTFKNFDLYSYESEHNYSTAIVFGSEDHEYMSGWIELALSDREEYKELFARECACNLITDSVILEVGRCYTDRICKAKEMEIINDLRKND